MTKLKTGKSRPAARSRPRPAGAPSLRGAGRDVAHVAVLDRATALLLALARFSHPASLNDAAAAANLSKATAFRILSTLSEHGLVEQEAATASYRLGIVPLRLATSVLESIPVHPVARPLMRSVCDMLNETVVLSVQDGDFRVNVDAAVCTNAIGSSRRIGEPRPLHAGAASRVLLAAMSDAEIEAYLKRQRLSGKTTGSPAYLEGLWKDVRKARRTGLVSSAAETSPAAQAIATAVLGPDGRALAALHVAIPQGRFSPRVEERCGTALLRAAAEISRTMAASQARRA